MGVGPKLCMVILLVALVGVEAGQCPTSRGQPLEDRCAYVSTEQQSPDDTIMQRCTNNFICDNIPCTNLADCYISTDPELAIMCDDNELTSRGCYRTEVITRCLQASGVSKYYVKYSCPGAPGDWSTWYQDICWEDCCCCTGSGSHGAVIDVNITSDNTILGFYADGMSIIDENTPEAGNWKVTKQVQIPADTQVYGIKSVNTGGPAGTIASFSDGNVTDETWRCTAEEQTDDSWLLTGFNDSTWQAAAARHPGSVRPNISPEANWIWTANLDGSIDDLVYCRKDTGRENPSTGDGECTDLLREASYTNEVCPWWFIELPVSEGETCHP